MTNQLKPPRKRKRRSKTGRRRRNKHPARWRANDATERLWNWFLRPLAKAVEITAAEVKADMGARLEWIFGGATRACTAVKTVRTIKLPDRRWRNEQTPNSRVSGASLQERLVPQDATLYIRRDDKYQGDVEVEFDGNVFVLYEHEFEELKPAWKILV